MATAFSAAKAVLRPLRFSATPFFISFCLAAATGLSGCAVGPDFVSPDPPGVGGYVPEKLSAIGGTGAFGWWRRTKFRSAGGRLFTTAT